MIFQPSWALVEKFKDDIIPFTLSKYINRVCPVYWGNFNNHLRISGRENIGHSESYFNPSYEFYNDGREAPKNWLTFPKCILTKNDPNLGITAPKVLGAGLFLEFGITSVSAVN